MSTRDSALRRSNLSMALARDRLGVRDIVFFNLSAAAPLTVVAGVVTTGFATTGITGIPVAFLAVAVVLALFAVGYVAMARHVANAGAFYAYVSQGLGRPLGVGAAWMALLAYNLLQVGLYGLIGVAAAPLLEQWLGVRTTWWVVALAAWALVAVLGVLRVDINGKVLAVLLGAEIALIVVFDVANLLHPADGQVSLTTLSPQNLIAPGVGAILVLAVLGFVGFENSVVFSEESREPRRTVPRATYLSIVIIAVVYAVSAWAMTVAVGPSRVAAVSAAEGPEVMFNLASAQLGALAADIGHALLVTSIVAAMISFHNTTARYAFALGRERVLPAAFGRTARSGSPVVGSVFQSALGLAAILLYAVAGWDPLVQLFYWLGTTGGIGVLLLIAITSLAVPAYFARQPSGESAWRRLGAPLLAAAGLLLVVALALANVAELLGVAPGSTLTWVVPGGYLALAVLGVAWGLVLRATRPDVYRRIGLGAKSATSSGPLDLGVPAQRAPAPVAAPAPAQEAYR
ncbi:MAG TPA: APC family permease [Pilimelia sp.]|nr:APC family permease [Pilimelia sp.]